MSYVSNPAPPSPRHTWRRFIFPMAVLIVFGALIASPWLTSALGYEAGGALFFILMLPWLAAPIAVLLLAVWWLFFSGFSWTVRLGLAILVIALGPVASILSIRKVEFTTTRVAMVPIFHFVWDAPPVPPLESSTDDLPPLYATVGPEDFPAYRGLKRDGLVTHLKLDTDWSKHPPKVLWRHACPGGYSGIAVTGNIVVTVEQRNNNEVVACYDRDTGRQRWTFAYDAYHKDVMGDGPRSTPTIHDDLIYSVGAVGDLVCLNAEGKKQWMVNLLMLSKAKNIQWGLTASPLIVDDLVIAQAGSNPEELTDSSLIAFDRKTGEKRWAVGNRQAGYSSPQLVTLAKVPQVLLFDHEGLVSYEPKTGRELWKTPWITKQSMNMMQPVVVGEDQVFISSEMDNGCALFRVEAPGNDAVNWVVKTVWANKNLAGRFANPVTDGKHIFGLQNLNGLLICLNANDGKVKWKGERYGPGQMLLVDEVLLIVNDSGEVSLLETNSSAANVLATFPVFDQKTWNTPALAGDQLFMRNQFEIACLRLPRR